MSESDEVIHPLDVEWMVKAERFDGFEANEDTEGVELVYGTGFGVGYGSMMDDTGSGKVLALMIDVLTPSGGTKRLVIMFPPDSLSGLRDVLDHADITD